MAASETQQELIRHLDAVTRELNPNKLGSLTTTSIADACNISRSLASQYLNDLVREGLAVKVNSRPVIFLHRAGIERYLQRSLTSFEFGSMQELFESAGLRARRDFEHAIGYDRSLAPAIMRIKSAIEYPPQGLPALIVGERGVGKALLARLAFDYGKNNGFLDAQATFVRLDCASWADGAGSLSQALRSGGGTPGIVRQAKGGIVLFDRFECLSHADREAVLSLARVGDGARPSSEGERPARFIISSRPWPDGSRFGELASAVPIVVRIPALRDRMPEERSELVMHFLRVEGRRAGANVSISRGALRTLVDGAYEGNIDGLRTCVINSCAGASLNREGDRLVIRAYNLPSQVLGSVPAQADDAQLVDCDKDGSGSKQSERRTQRIMDGLLDSFCSYQAGAMSLDELRFAGIECSHEMQDFLDFENSMGTARLESYERVLMPLVDRVNAMYGIELTRKMARTMGQLLQMQAWCDPALVRWKQDNAEALGQLRETLPLMSRTSAVILEQLAREFHAALGHTVDSMTWVILFLIVKEVCDNTTSGRERVGIIVCHGYSTATSIAEAANRILHARVFEAVDMRYEDQIQDVASAIGRLVERYAYCRAIALLTDTGTLSDIHDVVAGKTVADVYACDNVSTGLAVEVGAALVSGADLAQALASVPERFVPHATLIHGSHGADAVLFCSENGVEAADSLRELVQRSLPRDTSVRLMAVDYHELLRDGMQSQWFGRYEVRAIVGTMDPGISSVPFVALEDILYKGSSDVVDRVLLPSLGSEGIAELHANLLRNLTLRNVMTSISILNPEILYLEADRAVQRLANLSGDQIDARRRIGVYVHLCGLIERLVTKNFVDSYPGVEAFEAEHADFVSWFREAFADMSKRYRVEIPVSEIAYVHHMLHVPLEDLGMPTDLPGAGLDDE